MKIIPKILGRLYEAKALSYLKRRGLKLIKQNYCARFGEIDLIMLDGDSLVFVEVRSRASDRFGSALDSVTLAKQNRIIQTAQKYLSENTRDDFSSIRFDVLGITKGEKEQFTWIKNAFTIDR